MTETATVPLFSLGKRLPRRRHRPRFGLVALVSVVAVSLLPSSAQALGSAVGGPARSVDGADLPFRDPTLPLSTRVDDLLGRLTLAEKISLLHQFQPAIPRLGLKVFRTGTEALHGVA